VSQWANNDFPSALKYVQDLPDTNDKSHALMSLGSIWAQTDPRGAIAFAETLPVTLEFTARMGTKSDPCRALSVISAIRPGRAVQHRHYGPRATAVLLGGDFRESPVPEGAVVLPSRDRAKVVLIQLDLIRGCFL
jgi:hypothetical protein